MYVESTNDVIHLHNIEQWKSSPPPYNTKLGSIESLSPELDQHLPQLRI